MSGLKQTRLPGQATADYEAKQKRIKTAMNPQRHKHFWDLIKPSFEAMARRRLTFDNQAWEDAVKGFAKQKEFMDTQLRRGKDELTIKGDKLAMTDAEAKDFLATANELDLESEQWEIKEESQLEEDARQLKKAFIENPQIAATILNDPDILQAVKDGLVEVKAESKKIMDYIVGMEDRLYDRAKKDIQEMGLSQKFEDHIRDIDILLAGNTAARLEAEEARDEAENAREEAEEALEKSKQQLKDQRALLNTELQEVMTAKLSTATSELERTKSDLLELTTKHQELATKAQGLEKDLTESDVKVQDLNSKLQESNKKQKSSDDLEDYYKGIHERAMADHQEALEKRDEEHAAELKQKQKEVDDAATEANDYTIRLRKQHYEEITTRDKKHAADLNKELDQQKKDAEEQLKELRSKQQKALDSVAEVHATGLSKLREEHDEEKAELRRKHAAELKSRTGPSEDEFSALQVKNTQLVTQVKDHGSTMARLEKERDKLQALVELNPTELTAKVSALEREVEATRREKSESEQQLEMTRRLLAHFNRGLPEAMSKVEVWIQPTGIELDNNLPRMHFERETASLDPLLHAMSFWTDAREDRPSFGNTQPLFNTRVIDASTEAAYPWIVAALGANLGSMSNWGSDQLAFNRILTVLQGIAYLNLVANGWQIPLDDVRRLLEQTRACLNRRSDPELVIIMVFRKVESFVNGEQLTTWIDSDDASATEVRRLDGSNCALEASRCLIASITGEFYAFIDDRDVNETLYVFAESDVDKLFPQARPLHYQLQLKEGFVADCVGRQLPLGWTPAVNAFLSHFLTHKMAAKA
ncbi:MAG: hypothetical protein Q9207_003292 [Kuettlingeria erythrocarpa]